MTMTYYKTGEVKSVTDWRGYRTDYTIDKLGRTTVVKEAVGESEARTLTTVYNKVGEVTSTVDYNGNTTSYTIKPSLLVVYDVTRRYFTSTEPLPH